MIICKLYNIFHSVSFKTPMERLFRNLFIAVLNYGCVAACVTAKILRISSSLGLHGLFLEDEELILEEGLTVCSYICACM